MSEDDLAMMATHQFLVEKPNPHIEINNLIPRDYPYPIWVYVPSVVPCPSGRNGYAVTEESCEHYGVPVYAMQDGLVLRVAVCECFGRLIE